MSHVPTKYKGPPSEETGGLYAPTRPSAMRQPFATDGYFLRCRTARLLTYTGRPVSSWAVHKVRTLLLGACVGSPTKIRAAFRGRKHFASEMQLGFWFNCQLHPPRFEEGYLHPPSEPYHVQQRARKTFKRPGREISTPGCEVPAKAKN